MKIYMTESGPYMYFVPGREPDEVDPNGYPSLLYIEDLNPQLETRWALSRKDRFLIGVRFILSCWWR
jgi:hypothetical protein